MKERNVRCSAAEWRRMVEDHKVSGLAVAEYCRVKKLSVGSFYKWQKRFRGEGARYQWRDKICSFKGGVLRDHLFWELFPYM